MPEINKICMMCVNDAQINRWMHVWMYVCVNGWMDGWMDEWMVDGGWMDAWMHGCMNGWMGGLVGGWVSGWMDAWMHGLMNGWMDAYGWISRVGCPDAFAFAFLTPIHTRVWVSSDGHGMA